MYVQVAVPGEPGFVLSAVLCAACFVALDTLYWRVITWIGLTWYDHLTLRPAPELALSLIAYGVVAGVSVTIANHPFRAALAGLVVFFVYNVTTCATVPGATWRGGLADTMYGTAAWATVGVLGSTL